ncbi:MAG TPA: Arc family DNA-binding protein [Stenotrophomonas sp.]|nr:Arc family DNA-binding protein [Stenotrophomonas sp.]
MSRDINPFGLRLPPELKSRLEAAAAEAGRSLNAEIVWRLESTFSAPLTYMLIERRLDEIQEAQRKVVDWKSAVALLEGSARELQKARTPEAKKELGRVQADLDRSQRNLKIAQDQLDRIEEEANRLIEDLGRRVAAETGREDE